MAELIENEMTEAAGGKYDRHEAYVCLPGDTLNRIAYIYRTTPAALITLNNLNTPNLYQGQLLLVPKLNNVY